jgi:replicative DNA helicase
MGEIHDVQETIDQAVHTFYLDREGKPELIPFGFKELDEELGGIGPMSCGILAGATGVGKSSAMLTAVLNSSIPVGVVSTEDGPDVVGTRLLSALTGIDSLRIRRKDLTDDEIKTIKAARDNPGKRNIHFAYPIAGTVDEMEDAVAGLCDKGCKMVWLDYLQKIRGHREDRRHEVAETFTRFQRAVAKGSAAGMAISQFRRFGADERVPQIYHLKESGDLENEARVILLAHRFVDEHGVTRVRFRVGKSTYGGEWVQWDMVRDAGGTLRTTRLYDPTDNF